MIILRINRYVTRLLSGLSEHRRVLRRKDDWANRMISQWQTNRDSSSSITISSLNRKWIEHKRNLTNESPEQSRVLRWTMIWRYNNTSQLCTEDFIPFGDSSIYRGTTEIFEQLCFSSRPQRDAGQWVFFAIS